MSNDALKALEPHGSVQVLNGLCTAALSNELPCDWGVVIVGAAVQFDYREGGNYIDSEPNLNLTCNRSTTFRSSDATKCVGRVFLAAKVQVPGEPNPRISVSERLTPPGQCATLVEFRLAPKNDVAQSSLKTLSGFDRIQLVVSSRP